MQDEHLARIVIDGCDDISGSTGSSASCAENYKAPTPQPEPLTTTCTVWILWKPGMALAEVSSELVDISSVTRLLNNRPPWAKENATSISFWLAKLASEEAR